MAKKNNSGGFVRIIGGNWRGRRLSFPSVEGLRPTGDRIRETVFNWLQTSIGDANCLDLFAGSGALGFEAASRGANSVHLVEANAQVFSQLESSKVMLTAEQCQIYKGTAAQFLDTVSAPYDVVFLDPPFQLNLWSDIANKLVTNDLLSNQAKIYVEMPRHSEQIVLPNQWDLLREKNAGDVKYCLFEHLAGV